MLCATTAYTFSTAQLPKVLRRRCALHGLTSKYASRHNSVHFFRQLNFQKCSCVGVFCTVLLRNAVRATTAHTFSTAQLPKVLRRWCVLYGFTSKCASRHNGVHLFISHLPRLLRTCRFSHKSLLLSSDSFSSLIFFLLLFSSLTLPTSAFHLSIVGSLTSKLPSVIYHTSYIIYIYIFICISLPIVQRINVQGLCF